MLSRFDTLVLFASSYIPLFIALAVQFAFSPMFKKHAWPLWVLIGVASTCLLALCLFLRKANTTEPRPVRVAKVARKDGEAMAYIVSYILPLMAVDFWADDQQKFLASAAVLVLVVVLIALLYLDAHMVHVNPTLNLLRRHVYEIETDAGDTHTVITWRRRLVKGMELKLAKVTDEVFIEGQA